jgi:hypothetical protein
MQVYTEPGPKKNSTKVQKKYDVINLIPDSPFERWKALMTQQMRATYSWFI